MFKNFTIHQDIRNNKLGYDITQNYIDTDYSDNSNRFIQTTCSNFSSLLKHIFKKYPKEVKVLCFIMVINFIVTFVFVFSMVELILQYSINLIITGESPKIAVMMHWTILSVLAGVFLSLIMIALWSKILNEGELLKNISNYIQVLTLKIIHSSHNNQMIPAKILNMVDTLPAAVSTALKGIISFLNYTAIFLALFVYMYIHVLPTQKALLLLLLIIYAVFTYLEYHIQTKMPDFNNQPYIDGILYSSLLKIYNKCVDEIRRIISTNEITHRQSSEYKKVLELVGAYKEILTSLTIFAVIGLSFVLAGITNQRLPIISTQNRSQVVLTDYTKQLFIYSNPMMGIILKILLSKVIPEILGVIMNIGLIQINLDKLSKFHIRPMGRFGENTEDIFTIYNIELQNATLVLPNGQVVFNNTSCVLSPEEMSDWLLLSASSGAGKSVLFLVLLGFMRLTSGRILINGIPIEEISPKKLTDCFVYGPQVPRIIQNGNWYEMFIGIIGDNNLSPKKLLQLINYYTDLAGCYNLIHDKSNTKSCEVGLCKCLLEPVKQTLSGGQKARFSFAGVLLQLDILMSKLETADNARLNILKVISYVIKTLLSINLFKLLWMLASKVKYRLYLKLFMKFLYFLYTLWLKMRVPYGYVILFVDELFAALDHASTMDILDKLKSLKTSPIYAKYLKIWFIDHSGGVLKTGNHDIQNRDLSVLYLNNQQFQVGTHNQLTMNSADYNKLLGSHTEIPQKTIIDVAINLMNTQSTIPLHLNGNLDLVYTKSWQDLVQKYYIQQDQNSQQLQDNLDLWEENLE